jgi:hypothetical protein
MRIVSALIAVGLAIGVAACGSSSPASTSQGSASFNTSARFQARLKLAKCFRSHGINVPDPSPSGGVGAGFRALQNYPQSQIRTVLQDCRADAVQAFPALNLSPAQRAQIQRQLVKFAECMRAHGVNVPDPTDNANGVFAFRQAFRSAELNSPSFKSALSACRSVGPHFRHPGG